MEATFKPREIRWWLLPVLSTVTLAAGAGVVLLQKWMNRISVPPCAGCVSRHFRSPMWQTLVMFSGQSMALAAYKIDRVVTSKRGVQCHMDFPSSAESVMKPEIPKLYWIFPASLDLLGSTMCNVAFTITFASTVQILRNTNVVICAFLQLIYLGRPLKNHEWIGVIVITAGMGVTGVYGILTADPSSQVSTHYSWIGVALAIMGTCFISFQMTYEELLMRRFYASPIAAVGWQGIFGFVMTALTLVGAQLLGFEDVFGTSHQIRQSTSLLIANASYFGGVGIFNMAGMSVTKLAGAVLKSILYALRSALVWIAEIALRWNSFDWLNFAGVAIISFGFALYANVAPSSKFEQWMTKEISFGLAMAKNKSTDPPALQSFQSCA